VSPSFVDVAGRLDGKRIAISRSAERAGPAIELLRSLGASVWAVPLIRFEPARDPRRLAAAVGELERFAWVVVTSTQAARVLAETLRPTAPHRSAAAGERNPAWPGSVQVAAVGDGTARALADLGIPVSFQPERSSARDLARALATRAGNVAGQRVLFPRSNLAGGELTAGLLAAGAIVEEVEAYVTLPDQEHGALLARAIAASQVDVLVLTSPSNVDSLLAAMAADHQIDSLARVRMVAIGEATTARMSERKMRCDAQAARPDAPGIVDAIRGALR
jgi:uroporphyrinogen-III synthase